MGQLKTTSNSLSVRLYTYLQQVCGFFASTTGNITLFSWRWWYTSRLQLLAIRCHGNTFENQNNQPESNCSPQTIPNLTNSSNLNTSIAHKIPISNRWMFLKYRCWIYTNLALINRCMEQHPSDHPSRVKNRNQHKWTVSASVNRRRQENRDR